MIFQNAVGQEYKPFNLDSGEWYCRYSTKGGMFGGPYHSNYYATDLIKFYCDGDTTINNLKFKKLMYRGYTRSQIVEQTYISGYYGAIRNDTVEKNVFFISTNYNSNYEGNGDLLYNYNLGIGDCLYDSCFSDRADTISQIDSVSYCNKYYKRYNTSSGDYIIEGIGSKYGLLPVNYLTASGGLLCYSENENKLCDDCGYLTTIDSYPEINVKIFPNPVIDKVEIISDVNIHYIEVFNLNGILLDRYNSNFDCIEFRNEGNFMILIHTDIGIITKKLIKK